MDTAKEITDLLKSEAGQPPALTQVALKDPKYRHLARFPSTLAVKRKSVDLYKCRLRTRGDVAPLTVAGFMSSPTAHRCCLKTLCTLPSHLHWRFRALGISQAFPQSENLRPEDRIIGIPPSMVTLPWDGHLLPVGADMETLPPTLHGPLLTRPLYGGRDAPVRRWITPPKRLRAHG